MLVSYPLCAVYHETGKLEYVHCPDLKMKFCLDEASSKKPLTVIVQLIEEKITEHLKRMQAANFYIEPPKDLDYYRQQQTDNNKFWFEQALSIPDNRGIAERLLPVGGFMLSLVAGSLLLFMVLASSKLTFKRLNTVSSFAIGLLSALNTLFLTLVGYFLFGGQEMAANLGKQVDKIFQKNADKEEIFNIIVVASNETKENNLAVKTIMQDSEKCTAENEKNVTVSAQTQSLSKGARLFKYSAITGVSGLFFIDIGLRSMTTYQVLYRLGNAAFSQVLPRNVLTGLAGAGAGIIALDSALLVSGMLYKILDDLDNYLLTTDQNQEMPKATISLATVGFWGASSTTAEEQPQRNPTTYPVCFIYAPSGALKYVNVPDLRIRFVGSSLKGRIPAEITKVLLKEYIEHYMMHIQKLQMALPSPGNMKQYEHNEGGSNRLWAEIEIDMPLQKGFFQRLLPVGAVLASVQSWLMLSFMTVFASDLSFRSYGKGLSIAVSVVGVMTSFLAIMFINYLSDAREVASGIGKKIDDWFKKPLDEEVLIKAMETDYQPIALSEPISNHSQEERAEEMVYDAIWEERQKESVEVVISKDTDLIDEEVDVTALARKQAARHIHQVKICVGVAMGITYIFDAAIFAMVAYQSTYHLGRNAFDKALPESVVQAISLFDMAITLEDVVVVSAGLLSRILSIVEDYLLNRSIEALKEMKKQTSAELELDSTVKSESDTLKQVGIFSSRIHARQSNVTMQQEICAQAEGEERASSNYTVLP